MDGSKRPKISLASTWLAASATVVLCLLAASSGPIRLWENPGTSGTRTVRDQVAPPPEDEPRQEIEGTIDWPDLSWLLDVINVLVVLFLVLAVALAISDRRSWKWRLRRRIGRRAHARGGTRRRRPKFALPRSRRRHRHGRRSARRSALHATRSFAAGCNSTAMRPQSASGATIRRRPPSTSSRVVASTSVDPRLIAELASLYREARFSHHELDDAHRVNARLALQGVAAQLSEGPRDRV